MFKIYTIDPCKWCVKAKELAEELGYEIDERDFYAPSMWEWEEMIGFVPSTAPQIFVDGEYIGGCTDLISWIED